MAYDARTDQLVLFGGDDGRTFNGTRVLSGAGWIPQSPYRRPPLGDTMAYDGGTGQLILTEGDTPGGSYQTWNWNGSTWKHLAPATAPPERVGGSLAYDPDSHQLVLFGGCNGSAGNCELSDTWIWDGTNWTRETPAVHPAGRDSAEMAYDASTHQLELVGGYGLPGGGSYGGFTDQWSWHGSGWTQQRRAAAPLPANYASLAYDARLGALVLFGGKQYGQAGDRTWAWTGTAWSPMAAATRPTARTGASMAYDPHIGDLVLFGGTDQAGEALGDTWTYG